MSDYKMLEAIDIVKRDMENIIEFYQLNAKLEKAKYDAYIAEGFTEEQALKLCKLVSGGV